MQAGEACAAEASHPLAHRARADAYGFADGLRRLPALNDATHHGLSTGRRETRILMDVHSVPPWNGCLATPVSPAGTEWTTYRKLTSS